MKKSDLSHIFIAAMLYLMMQRQAGSFQDNQVYTTIMAVLYWAHWLVLMLIKENK